MIPIGVGIVFAAYATGIWGYCLVRGYNVKFTQLFAATWPGSQSNSASPGGSGPAGPAARATSGPAPRG